MKKELVLKFNNSPAKEVFEFEATIEVNELSEPMGAEVFGLADSLGEKLAIRTASFLDGVVWRVSYDPDVDSLSFSFGDGTKSGGQINGSLHVGLSGENVVVVNLFKVQ